MLEELINTYEELKKYVYIIDRGKNGLLIIKFDNRNFYHLVGLHKTNIAMFIPSYIKTQDKKYKYIKKNITKFNNILESQIKEKDLLILRINTFTRIKELLNNSANTMLHNLRDRKVEGSLYNGDYGLVKVFEDNISCLLGLKQENENNNIINCVPQSWMASERINRIIEYKRPIYMKSIVAYPANLYNQDRYLIAI